MWIVDLRDNANPNQINYLGVFGFQKSILKVKNTEENEFNSFCQICSWVELCRVYSPILVFLADETIAATVKTSNLRQFSDLEAE